MNENDRQYALRIYQENMRDVMDYRIARDKKITEERRQKIDAKRAEKVKKSGKTEDWGAECVLDVCGQPEMDGQAHGKDAVSWLAMKPLTTKTLK